ncbi:SDR family oxidoreductase [Geothrix sp. PMB-07]|uniref:SDR family oxidoreductase n=1 Tax=Geothrix sp. PMB-07 TaxID=3068640 RepID=UPI0027408952|nr:SDR family oxidoreductase [Geothrix sp. PMB-07]WLT30105.1 SDR family oxidoreductase [Geothrix sp. PMB-07]
MNYLITGATGNIGGRVVERLAGLGLRPRVFVRDRDKAWARFGDRVEVAEGDLSDRPSLSVALKGMAGLFLVNGGPSLGKLDGLAAEAAREAGVKRLVKLSSFDVHRTDGSSVGAWHAEGESAIRATGLSYTFLQPAGFMSNALAWASSIQAEGAIRASTGEGRIAMIHDDDIAAMAVKALLSGAHQTSWPITGPEALSYAEMAARIGGAIGKPLRFHPISDGEAFEGLCHKGLPPAVAEALVALWRAVREGHLATVTDTVERVLGRKPISFTRWALEHRSAFR